MVNPSPKIGKMLDKEDKTVERKKWTDDVLNPKVADHGAVDWFVGDGYVMLRNTV